MIPLKAFEKISEYEWRLPLGFRSDMRVPVRFFATRRLLEHALQDASIEQALNASTLPGVLGEVLVMPDVHQGYGFPDWWRGGHVLPGRGHFAGSNWL